MNMCNNYVRKNNTCLYKVVLVKHNAVLTWREKKRFCNTIYHGFANYGGSSVIYHVVILSNEGNCLSYFVYLLQIYNKLSRLTCLTRVIIVVSYITNIYITIQHVIAFNIIYLSFIELLMLIYIIPKYNIVHAKITP